MYFQRCTADLPVCSCALLFTPPARPCWPATARRYVLLRVHVSPVLPCTGMVCASSLTPRKQPSHLCAMQPLHMSTSESTHMLKLGQRRTLCYLLCNSGNCVSTCMCVRVCKHSPPSLSNSCLLKKLNCSSNKC